MKKFILIFLYLLSFNTSFGQKLKKLGIEIDNATYNFGDVSLWENQAASFQITNNSKHAVSILPLFSENDLEIIYPNQAIYPGETALIKAIYYTSGTGSFTRKFPIYFNTSPEAYELKITGNIKALSPTAYIQCPMAKPEHSKPKGELFGNVAEIESEIPLSGASVQIINLSSKGNASFFADKNGDFGSKLPTGNYEIIVEHPNYKPHHSFFFLGQNSGYLKVRLEPILPLEFAQEELALNKLEEKEKLPIKQDNLPSELDKKTPNKVDNPEQAIVLPNEEEQKENLALEPLESKKPSAFEQSIPKDDLYYKSESENKLTTSTNPVSPSSPYESPTLALTTIAKTEEPYQVPPSEIKELPSVKENSLQTWKTPVVEESEVTSVPSKDYVVRVIDKKSLDPIPDADIYYGPILNKKKTRNIKSDYKGMAILNLEKDDYKIVASADNYISGESLIRIDDDNEIIRIYLNPVSDLFNSIYEAKKEEQKPEEFLNQLSFGRTEFSFARDEQSTPPQAVDLTETETTLEEPLLATNQSQEEEEEEANQPIEIEEELEISSVPVKNSINLDSIQSLMAQLEAEKAAMQAELNRTEESLAAKNAKLLEQEENLAKKTAELEQEKLALAMELAANKEELKSKELALEELESKKPAIPSEATNKLELSKEEYAANNVLFLIDVSSSMAKENKMELLKESMKNLALVLRDIDRVAIIAYNQKSEVVLESISGSDKVQIIEAIDNLETSGLTYGVYGLQTAYELLQYYYIGDGNNQIILATDGLFSSVNAPITENELNKEVRKQASNNNIRLSVIGFGQDEEGEKLMQKLASNGEGQFIQIKNPWEAKTVLIEEIKLNSRLQ
ncbi:MAG: VWA domain-containing protein [Chitinophagales bacterium]|nr:VWA domain-containing protein [Chitinophagales bacterium]